MTYEEAMRQLGRDYGEAGPLAMETSCVVEADCAKGYDHVVSLILPALEEELAAQNGDLA